MEKEKPLIIKTLLILITVSLFILFLFILRKLLNYSLLIILTIIFSYIFSILTTFFHSKKINLILSKLISIFIVLAFIGFVLFILIPPVINEVAKILGNFESISKNFSSFLLNLIENLRKIFEDFKYFQIDIETISNSLNKSLGEIITNIIANIFSFLNLTLRLFIEIAFAFVISAFFIFDRERFLNGLINEIPERFKDNFLNFFNQLNFYLKKYLLGQIIISSLIGFTLYIFALIFKIPYAGTLGFIAAVSEIILYIGPIFTFILGLTISFTVSPITALWFALFYLAQQQITSYFIYPIVWSKVVTKVSPVVIFIVMILLLSLFGPLSLFFTVPLIIILKVIYNEFKKTPLYSKFKNL